MAILSLLATTKESFSIDNSPRINSMRWGWRLLKIRVLALFVLVAASTPETTGQFTVVPSPGVGRSEDGIGMERAKSWGRMRIKWQSGRNRVSGVFFLFFSSFSSLYVSPSRREIENTIQNTDMLCAMLISLFFGSCSNGSQVSSFLLNVLGGSASRPRPTAEGAITKSRRLF